MKAFRWLWFVLMLLLGTVVHAENGCPPGMIPASGTGINSCVPIPPGYYRVQQRPQPQRLPPQWVSQWGAMATDEPNGILGTATALTTKYEAKQTAMADCQAKGGSPCKHEIAYANQCASLVVGTKDYSINTGRTADAANRLAMESCSAGGDKKCHVYYFDCSLPIRIQ